MSVPKIDRPAIRNLLNRGVIYLYILKILKDNPLCWRERMRKILKEQYNVNKAGSSLFCATTILSKFGYIKQQDEIRGGVGKPRKPYVLTEKGEKLLEAGIYFLERSLKKLSPNVYKKL